jgi:hypothetical protein
MLFELVTLRNVSGETIFNRAKPGMQVGERASHYPSIYPSFYPSILLLPFAFIPVVS